MGVGLVLGLLSSVVGVLLDIQKEKRVIEQQVKEQSIISKNLKNIFSESTEKSKRKKQLDNIINKELNSSFNVSVLPSASSIPISIDSIVLIEDHNGKEVLNTGYTNGSQFFGDYWMEEFILLQNNQSIQVRRLVNFSNMIPIFIDHIISTILFDALRLIIITFVLFLLLHWYFTGPLKKFVDRVVSINHADSDTIIEPPTKNSYNELEYLSEQFNHLAVTMNEAVKKRDEAEQIALQLTQDFEEKVRDRTKELHESNDELQAKLEELHKTQGLLLQAQRMASMGHLAAGIAHEINNPVAVVYSNIATLSEYLTELIGLAEQYREAEVHINDAPTLTGLSKLRDAIDFDFVRDDAPDLVKASKNSLERVRNIVDELRTFSDSDTHKVESITVEEIMSEALKEIDFEKFPTIRVTNMVLGLPTVQGVRSQLKLVFDKILKNALEAMPEGGNLEIAGIDDNQSVSVMIKDTGRGMSEDQIHSAINPFYTQKEIGSGMGLGLTVAYNLVSHHGGEINIDSEVGNGTVVTIKLPLESALAE